MKKPISPRVHGLLDDGLLAAALVAVYAFTDWSAQPVRRSVLQRLLQR